MTLQQALSVVKSAGYRVSKPRAKSIRPTLNAIGRPFSPSFDPNYRMKYKAGNTSHLYLPYGRWMKFVGERS